MNNDVIIIGGGLAGLSCAHTLERKGIAYLLLEASETVGGRVRTDQADGFLLDRGFQVFSTAYPEAKRILDYPSLNLYHFIPGAVIRFAGKWHRLLDPFRHPFSAFATLMTPIGTCVDKIRVATLRYRALSGTIQEIFSRPEKSSLELLQSLGFTPSMIDRFFRPFFGGIFLDPDLQTSSRLTDFIFRMFAAGHSALPAEGMGAIPQQIGSRLSPDRIRTQAKVLSCDQTTVQMASGETLSARAVVLATDGPSTAQLMPSCTPPPYRSVTSLYFAAQEPPFEGPYLLLNGEGSGPINNLCVVSQVAPTYSTTSRQLISISVVNTHYQSQDTLESQVRTQLEAWFGAVARTWDYVRTSRIKTAQPRQGVPFSNPYDFHPNLGNGLFICGDFCTTGTIDGAIFSGRQAGEAVIDWLEKL